MILGVERTMMTFKPSAAAGAGVPFFRVHVILQVAAVEWKEGCTSHVTRHTSHVTRHLPSTQRPTESPPPGGGENLTWMDACR